VLTIAVPTRDVAANLRGSEGVRTVVWDCSDGSEPPARERDAIDMVCVPHMSGGRGLYERIGALPNVRLIQIPSAGFEHALPFIPEGVALANGRGLQDSRVAEFAVALAIMSRRLMPQFADAQARGAWEPEYSRGQLADSRALILGFGSIGAALAERLRAMEVHVEGVGRTARTAPDGTVVHASEDLASVLPECDILFVVTPLNDETHGLVGRRMLSRLPDGALVVNVGRGPVVDTEALMAECASGRLHAALDVIDGEPLPEGHPAFSTPHMIITPHVAGFTPLTDSRYTDLIREQALTLQAGGRGINIVAVGPHELSTA